MAYEVINFTEKLGPPTTQELISKCDSIVNNHCVRGESELLTSLCMLSYALQKIMQITQSEQETVNLVNETLDAHLPDEYIGEEGIYFTADFELDPEN
jgi:hypothetical protein|tara:strand:- start:8394 stop:8687 length:294 start_codon:yes stop_codon:yes gene_type:complete